MNGLRHSQVLGFTMIHEIRDFSFKTYSWDKEEQSAVVRRVLSLNLDHPGLAQDAVKIQSLLTMPTLYAVMPFFGLQIWKSMA
jgi:hypothetical protein